MRSITPPALTSLSRIVPAGGLGGLGAAGSFTRIPFSPRAHQRMSHNFRASPWLPIGRSNGGDMSNRLNVLHPEKTIAIARNIGWGRSGSRPALAALMTQKSHRLMAHVPGPPAVPRPSCQIIQRTEPAVGLSHRDRPRVTADFAATKTAIDVTAP